MPPVIANGNNSNCIYLQDVEIKAMTHPYDDLPSDAQIFGQLIVDRQIIQQTVPVDPEPSQDSWKLDSGFKIPGRGLGFTVAIMRHSQTRGTRLLGYFEAKHGFIFGPNKTSLDLDLTKVNSDGPLLKLIATVESSPPMEQHIATNNPKNKTNSIKSHLQTILAGLEQIEGKLEREIRPTPEELWTLHTNILFLPATNARRGRLLHLCGDIALNSWKMSRMMDHLNEAISAYEDAVRDVPANLAYLGDHGIALYQRFEELGDVADLNKGVVIQKDVVHLTPDEDPDLPARLTNLGNSLCLRFQRLGDLDDLSESISKHKNAVYLIPDSHPDMPARLNSLGNSLQLRFKRLDDASDLNDCILHHKNAIGLSPDDCPNKPFMLNNLGNSLHSRFTRFGDLNDLNEAIWRHENAINLTQDDHTHKPIILSNLASSLRSRFERLGDLDDLNNSISKYKVAIELTPKGHLNLPTWLDDLASALQLRFQRLGDLEDLTESLSKHRNAVELTPCGHPSKPERFNNLGNALQLYFERLGDHCSLDDCISNHRKAVHLTPDDHPYRPIMLHNLGSSLQSRFERFGDLNDLDEAISRQKDAVKLIPDGHPNQFRLLNNLGHCLQIRFEELGDLNDLTEFISKHKYAVHLTPDGHFDRPETRNNLGNALFLRFKQSNNPDDIWETIQQYTSAACSTTGPAYKRFHAASKWAQHAQTIQHHSLLDAYQTAIDLLPELAWLGLSITDRHYLIMKAAPVVRDAAVAAISSAQLAKAVEWLEQGRSIIWGQLLNLRSPVEILRLKSPKLADDLIHLSAQLEGATTRRFAQVMPDSGAQQPLTLIVQQVHEIAHKRELLLKTIRELEGFNRFLLPKSISELSMAAQRGPVIFLNASQMSCDVLILLPGPSDRVLHVPLLEFTPKDLKTLTQTQTRLMSYKGRSDTDRLYGNREGESQDREDDFAHILSELWVHLVKPVLNAIAITTPAKENLQRVWWCPTGPFTSLPIHAAGLYGKDDSFGSKLSDYVISSYTPSLAALIQGFRPFSQLPERLQLLAVAQPSAVGQLYIPGTENEINRIQQSAHSKIAVCSLVAHEATVARVEDEIMKSNWVHFACHGVQDQVAPTESALLLAGNSRLTLSRIIQLNLPHAEFAFLSACQTATGEQKLQEESVHLAAGMLLAGYRGVIATMWSITDNDAPQVAEDVYKHLFKSSPPNSTRAAEALHLAVKNLRQGSDGKKSFFHWVPFIHVGV
ncbi:hypothetical protein MVEN_02248400 [Mycena venus]|uniref:CHAT domain-containing protein n=1 Tax=Mycena venus TaxID=2733690 RepID=A0A8H6X5P9_9AGAR|nr:hypothetical protein MVEN_02248400 [Mycena venus]